MNNYKQQLLEEAARLGVSFASKNKKHRWLWATLDWFLKRLGHRGILNDFVTCFGKTIYFPGDSNLNIYTDIDQAVLLSHELQHMRDIHSNWFTYPFKGLWYLLSKSYRLHIEKRGYFRTLEAIMIFDHYISDGEQQLIVNTFSNKDYFNMMGKEEAKAWVTYVTNLLFLLEREEKLPLSDSQLSALKL